MEVLKELLLLGLSTGLEEPTPAVLIAQVLRKLTPSIHAWNKILAVNSNIDTAVP